MRIERIDHAADLFTRLFEQCTRKRVRLARIGRMRNDDWGKRGASRLIGRARPFDEFVACRHVDARAQVD
jgi:hypothetical protein